MKQIALSFLCLSAFTLSVFADDKPAAADSPAVNNTAINKRDKSDQALTSGDQSNSPADIKLTAAIRRAIIADKSLSMTASNIKIITANGKVTLRGPVKTAAEKATAGQIAMKQAGQTPVDNQLEVEAAK
ncbi:MAG: BON domain-containing protein [Verrucomicrobiota bacterium]|nr:BON domain-containing protein [Verrucomicrobiota bacterium]